MCKHTNRLQSGLILDLWFSTFGIRRRTEQNNEAKTFCGGREVWKVRSRFDTVTVGCEHAHWCADCLVTTWHDQPHSSISHHEKDISTEKWVAITLWFHQLALTTEQPFGVSKSSVCVVTKKVCAAIVECLLPKYIKIPSGAALRKTVEPFKMELGFHSVLELWMALTYRQFLYKRTPKKIITTERSSIPLSFRELIMLVKLLMYMFSCQAKRMKCLCFQIQIYTTEARAKIYFLIWKNQSLAGIFHLCSLVIQHTPYCSGWWKLSQIMGY